MNHVEQNIADIRKKVAEAALKSGRKPEDILILAVSKTIDTDTIKLAVDCGLTELGENRVQEVMDKYDKMGSDVKWHIIGHLQTNKVKYIIDKVKLIHSIESIKLAEEIDKRAQKLGKIMDVLVEVNAAAEESKFGISPNDTESFIREISKLKSISVKGLMTVAPNVENGDENRQYFRLLKQLLVDINSKKIDNVYMDQLSMGMTGDYIQAIEEGSTIVRIGTGIFGSRTYN